jgi:protein O-mannosyl-transferase
MFMIKKSYTPKTVALAPEAFLTRPFPVLALLSLLAILIYSNTFSSTFHFDDTQNIMQNPKIKDLSNFTDLTGNRYVGFLSFALNYAIGGLDVFGYHLLNLAIHIANGFLVYTLVLLLFRAAGRTATFQNRIPWIALVTALLFIAHPIQTQAVTYIVQRFACLVTLFYLLTVVAYLKWRMASPEGHRRYLWYGVALVSTVLAMKTKENSITLPFMLLLVEGIFFRPITRKRWVALIPFLLMLPIIPLDRADMLGEAEVGLVQQTTDISRLDYLFTQFRVIMTYLRLLILPIHQNLDYDYPIYSSLFHPAVFFSFLFLVGLLTLAVYLLIRSRRMTANSPLTTYHSPLIPFGILWFFLTLSVESSIIPIVDVIFEHRLYLPSIGLFLCFTIAVFAGLGALQARRPKGDILSFLSSPKPLIGFVVLILLLFAVISYQRNHVWKDERTLWEDVVRKAPGKARGHNNLGLVYWNLKRSEEALNEYQVALTLNPDYLEAHNNIGMAYQGLRRFEEAIREYQTALTLEPGFTPAYYNLGTVYHDLGRLEEAIREYEKALMLDPRYVKARVSLGIAYHARGRFDDAIREYERAITHDPQFAKAYVNLGAAYHVKGYLKDAIREYEMALTLNPAFIQAHYNLGNVYHGLGRHNEAIREYRATLRLDPDYVPAHINLGITYHTLGRLEEAVQEYEMALTLDPMYAKAHYNLGQAYWQLGRVTEAKEEFELALKIKPDYLTARQALESLSQ